MKQSILLLLAMLLASPFFAQITFERPDYNFTTEGGTIVSWNMATDGVMFPEEGANVVWDYSAQALSSSYSYSKEPLVSDPLFTDANLVEMSSGLALNLVEQGVNFYERLDQDGYKVVGRSTAALSVPAQTITGGANDTISFLGSSNLYEEPLYYVKFPMNYEDTWDTEINIEGNYLMTVAAFGLNHVPASSIYNYKETKDVAGYGTLILPHPDGDGTVSLDALLLKGTTVRTDSFFLAGQPAPQLMLDALGLVQGGVSIETDYLFYAKGLDRSALYVGVKNGQITTISMADDIRNVISAIKLVPDNLVETTVFPNPTTGNFQVSFDKPDAKAWDISIYDPLGRLVNQAIIDAPAGEVSQQLSLPRSTNPGWYPFVIRNADRMVRASGRILLK